MKAKTFLAALSLATVALVGPAAAQGSQPAKEIFGAKALPADLAPRPIGFYSRGCLAGAVAMPVDGPQWQVMRLSRNRNWGHPELIAYMEQLARTAQQDGWPGLLVGDISQPRGGPMLTGHASHQIGLDADIWLTPMPNRRLSAREREEISAVPVVEPGPHVVDPNIWTNGHFRLIRRAASDPRVDRIFVAPGIKKKLCESETGARGWLKKVRPYWGHNYHFHVRLGCPAGVQGCRDQDPPPNRDGCGADLDYWYSEEPYRPAADPEEPAKPVTLADLPKACTAVAASGDRPGTRTARDAYLAGGERSPAALAAEIMSAPPADRGPAAPLPRSRPD